MDDVNRFLFAQLAEAATDVAVKATSLRLTEKYPDREELAYSLEQLVAVQQMLVARNALPAGRPERAEVLRARTLSRIYQAGLQGQLPAGSSHSCPALDASPDCPSQTATQTSPE